jgi:NAD(P)-dependent dehydrogenase (short-subunit alcohol dehydrogenase family)
MESVVVTGASTGIGRSCVRRLAADGFRVFAGVRDPADAEELSFESSSVVPHRIRAAWVVGIRMAGKRALAQGGRW